MHFMMVTKNALNKKDNLETIKKHPIWGLLCFSGEFFGFELITGAL
jgi:hypothetical protein